MVLLKQRTTSENLCLDTTRTIIDLIPIAICAILPNGHLQSCNLKFKERMSFLMNSENAPPIQNILDVIGVDHNDKFYSALQSLQKLGGALSTSGEFLTKSCVDGIMMDTICFWTLAMSPDRKMILATLENVKAEAMMSSSEKVYKAHSDQMIKKQFQSSLIKSQAKAIYKKTNNHLATRFSGSSTWLNFTNEVEENARKEMELKESKLRAQVLTATLETKRIFVRHVSHEIRTPLNVVVAGLEYIGSLFERSLRPEVAETLSEIKGACAVAVDILNDLLAYEKLDSNSMLLERSSCDMLQIIHHVHNMFMIQARYSNIKLTLKNHIARDAIYIDADSPKLSQAIRNLIANAFKFTPVNGEVTLTLFAVSEGQRVRLEVQDTGPGITKEDRMRLFSDSLDYDPNQLQNAQGMGLGLFLSHKIIRMHDGVIGVDMDWEGKGSIFFIELPMPKRAPSAAKGSQSQ